MSKFIDVSGQVFGRITVLERIGADNHGQSLFKCVCSCGNFLNANLGRLKSGNTKSCGCLKSDSTKKRNIKHGNAFSNNKTAEYRTYHAMITRCYNPNQICYKNYGGRGIKICDRWLDSFENFLEDMGKKPSKDFSIERIDVNGNYEPNNCKWIHNKEQYKNKVNTAYILYNGVKYRLKELCRYIKCQESALRNMIKIKGVENSVNYYIKKHKINELGQN